MIDSPEISVPAPEEPAMEFHKPKPIHSWRDLFKEIGIIVMGVSIALAAEQMVEYFHWRNEVSIARKALQDEIISIDRFYIRRIGLAPCEAKQEQEAKTILDSLEYKGKAVPFTAFHHGAGTLLVDSEWQSERSAQVLTHFPRAELALMNRYYAILPSIVAWIEAESIAWSELSILQNPPARFEPPDIAKQRGQLDRAHRLNFLIVLNGYRMLKLSDQMGIVRPKPDRRAMDAFCNLGDDRSEVDFLNIAKQP